jgi:hypothetical protein
MSSPIQLLIRESIVPEGFKNHARQHLRMLERIKNAAKDIDSMSERSRPDTQFALVYMNNVKLNELRKSINELEESDYDI